MTSSSFNNLAVEVIRNNMAVRQQNDLRLYLDVIADPNKPDIPPGSIMIFLKHFDDNISAKFPSHKLNSIQTTHDIDSVITALNDAFQKALSQAVPVAKPSPHSKRWWSKELSAERKALQTLKNRTLKPRATEHQFQAYREARN